MPAKFRGKKLLLHVHNINPLSANRGTEGTNEDLTNWYHLSCPEQKSRLYTKEHDVYIGFSSSEPLQDNIGFPGFDVLPTASLILLNISLTGIQLTTGI